MPTEAEYVELPVRITRDAIYFGDEKVPGCIEEDSITLKPGMADGFNRLTVTFLVGRVEAVDPVAEETTIEWPAQEVTRYRALPNPYSDLKCASTSPSVNVICERESHHAGAHINGVRTW